jgi:hypothetical protein
VRLRIAVCTAVTAVNPFAVATNLPLAIIVVVAALAAATFDILLIVILDLFHRHRFAAVIDCII